MTDSNNAFRCLMANRTTSTMDLARVIAAEPQYRNSFFAVFAHEQLCGRGRGGSRWLQPEQNESKSETELQSGNVDTKLTDLAELPAFATALAGEKDLLPFTLGIPANRIEIPPDWVSLAIGCAVIDALWSFDGFLHSFAPWLPFVHRERSERLALKWPNDIISLQADGYGKICGILCEADFSGQEFSNFYIGIGLNFLGQPAIPHAMSLWQWLVNTKSPARADQRAIKRFLGEREMRDYIFKQLLTFLEREIKEYLFVPRAVGQLRGLAMERAIPIGTVLSVNKGKFRAPFANITEQAALVLEGLKDPVVAGDVMIEEPELSLDDPAENPTIIPPVNPSSIVRISHKKEDSANPILAKKSSTAAVELKTSETKRIDAKFQLALDLGNTRLHWRLERNEEELAHDDLRWEALPPDEPAWRNAFLPLTRALAQQRQGVLDVVHISVTERERVNEVIDGLRKLVSRLFPEMKFYAHEMGSGHLLTQLNLVDAYPPEMLGADRAVRLYFAIEKSREMNRPLAIISLGTAFTCEAVSTTGVILESLIAPGLQMSLDGLHRHTARLPKLSFTPETAIHRGQWNTETSMQRGVLFQAAGAIQLIATQHGISTFFVTGGNTQDFLSCIGKIITKFNQEIELVPLPGLECMALLMASRRNEQANRLDDPWQNERTTSVIRSMLKARTPGRREDDGDIVAHKLTDFRRIGPRFENVGIGERLDRYLATKFKFHTRDIWVNRIEASEVLIEQNTAQRQYFDLTPKLMPVKPTYHLKTHDQIWLYHPPEHEPDHLSDVEVLSDDGDIVIFSKPGNLVIHAVGLYCRNTFLNIIAGMGYKEAAPIHRIDRETSGILLCARSKQARNDLAQAFRDGEMHKMYFAICKGRLIPHPYFRVELPIGDDEKSRIRLKLWVDGTDAVPAVTWFSRLATFDDYTLFACLPQTGRTNQIRIHLAAIGAWIVGDKMYHANEDVFLSFYEKGMSEWVQREVLFPRHMLHNALIQGPPELNYGICKQPSICTIPADMIAFEPLRELMKRAGMPLTAPEQQKFISDLYAKLQTYEFEKAPEIKTLVSTI